MRVEKISELIRQAEQGQLLLPNFQREFTYDRQEQKDLLLSVFCGIPLGSVLTLSGNTNDFNCRNIGRKSNALVDDNLREVKFLLDGQQRISTLWNCMTDIYDSVEDRDELYDNIHNYLRSRWFVSFRKDSTFKDDVWGLEHFDVYGDLLDQLVPEDLRSYLIYDKRVKSDPMNWSEGFKFPTEIDAMSSSARAFLKYIDETWSMPIHLILKGPERTQYIRYFATKRKNEISSLVRSWKEAGISFSDFSDSEILLLQKIARVESQANWLDLTLDKFDQLLANKCDSWVDSLGRYFQKVEGTNIGVVELDKSYLKKAHVVFDVINKSGVKLSAFDLFCATKPGIDVRKEVNDNVPHEFGMKDEKTGLVSVEFSNQLMNLIRVINAHNKDGIKTSSLKDDDIFRMTSEELEVFLLKAIESLVQAYVFVQENCGVRKLAEMPYKLQVLPIAFGIYLSGGYKIQERNCFRYYYWLSLMGGRYRESQNSRCTKDLDMFSRIYSSSTYVGPEWPPEFQLDGELFNRILNDPGYNDENSLIPQNGEIDEFRSSVEKSIIQFVLSMRPKDFPPNSSQTIHSKKENLQVHHILPLGGASFNEIGESSAFIRSQKLHFLNSPLNLAYISQSSNGKIGAMSYADYSRVMSEDDFTDYCLPDEKNLELGDEEQQIEWLKGRHKKLRSKIRSLLKELTPPKNH